MEFTHKKLGIEEVGRMRAVPVRRVEPYVLTLAPHYVPMRANEKLIAIKGPLDFYAPAELERLAAFETIYIPASEQLSAPFRLAAEKTRELLKLEGEDAPAPFELSDRVLRALAPSWSPDAMIEPFFVAVFMDALCDPMTPESLNEGHSRGAGAFERALVSGSWVAFLALHLGYCDLRFLSEVRQEFFLRAARGEQPRRSPADELEDLFALSALGVARGLPETLDSRMVSLRPGRAPEKFRARMERVIGELLPAGHAVPSVRGPGGFVDG